MHRPAVCSFLRAFGKWIPAPFAAPRHHALRMITAPKSRMKLKALALDYDGTIVEHGMNLRPMTLLWRGPISNDGRAFARAAKAN
jgi:hypothetical protein